MKKEAEAFFRDLQKSICAGLESMDGSGKFSSDVWERKEGGGGITNTIKGGNIIEKGGVAFSAVHGPTPEKIMQALGLPAADFFASGVSIVLHPYNPWHPIIHMNVRYFEMSEGTWWFGGGIDLTPHYINPFNGKIFHSSLKTVCDKFHPDYYSRFKNWADDYFYLAHRGETRGIGGIFFDRLSTNEPLSKEELFQFVKEVGNSFVNIYSKQIELIGIKSFTEREKLWQKLRRSRYVEFNLLYDKGTKFGLDTGGRTESILLSMPPEAVWEYNYSPEKNSAEEKTLQQLKKAIDWINV
ncbi:MAG: oxygen-dependent coproporphyrinogen oxidase [Cytophagaceae bacterium]